MGAVEVAAVAEVVPVVGAAQEAVVIVPLRP